MPSCPRHGSRRDQRHASLHCRGWRFRCSEYLRSVKVLKSRQIISHQEDGNVFFAVSNCWICRFAVFATANLANVTCLCDDVPDHGVFPAPQLKINAESSLKLWFFGVFFKALFLHHLCHPSKPQHPVA